MDNQGKEGDPDSRESNELKISELFKALAERKSPPCESNTHVPDPRNLGTPLSVLKNTSEDAYDCNGTFRSRAALPRHVHQLSRGQFRRQDHLSESVPAPLPVPAPVTEEEPSQDGSARLTLALLLERSKMSSPDRIHIHPHILGIHAWSKKLDSDPRWPPPKQITRTGPTSQWYFENLKDLERKLFVGASKTSGVRRNH